MKYCNKCLISIKTNHDYCPLCHQTLEIVKEEDIVEKFPVYKGRLRPVHQITRKIMMFISITSVVILFVINFFTGFDSLWSLIPIGSTLFFWLLMTVGIFSRHNIAFKLFILTITLIFFVYMIDELSASEGWALDYVAPLLLFSCNAAISFIILVKRINYRDYISYLLLIALFSIVPVIFLFTDIITVLWPSLASFALAIFILTFIIFFFPKSIKDEIKKRFHA